jgi:hypothetical protein
MLFTADPNSYVMFEGAALLITEMRSIAVRQVGTADVSVQASNPDGAGPQRKFRLKLNEPETPEDVVLVTLIVLV